MASEEEDQNSGADELRADDNGQVEPSGQDEDRSSDPNAELDDEEEYSLPGRDVILIFAVFFEGGLAPFSLLLGWLLGHMPLSTFAWRWQDAALGAAAALPLILVFLAIMHLPIRPFLRFQKFCDEEVTP